MAEPNAPISAPIAAPIAVPTTGTAEPTAAPAAAPPTTFVVILPAVFRVLAVLVSPVD